MSDRFITKRSSTPKLTAIRNNFLFNTPVTPILPSRSNNTYDSSFDATNASMKEDNSGIDDASMMDDDVIEDSLIENKENDGEISRERSLLGTPVTKTRLSSNIFTPQTRKDRELRNQRKHSNLSDVFFSDDKKDISNPSQQLKTSFRPSTTSMKSMNNSNGDVDVDASMMNVDTVNDSLIEEKENDEELSHELGSTLPDDTKKSLDAVPKSEAESLSSSDDEKYDDPILIESSSDDGKKSVETKPKPRVIVESMSSSDDEKCDDPVLIESSSDDGKKSAKMKSMPKVIVSSSSNDESILIESSSDNEKKPAKTKPMPKVVVESFSSSDDETNADPIVIDSFSSAMGNKSNTDPILIESSSDDGKRSVKTKLKPNLVVESSSDDDKKYIKKKPKPEIIDLDPYIKGEKRFYGGKMTDKRKEKIAAVTEEVIEQIHGSLDSMPENVVTETPDDLTVDLMLHQKHGLTWMKWRENNKAPRGGILADDMGLGKTLSMISLIVSQKNDRKNFSEVKEKLAADMKKHFSYEKDVRPGYCTLVVAPASVIYQWEKEIKDRVKPGKLKVYVFHGPRRERDPMVLARNDIVITTYNTISSELGEDKDLIGHDSDDDNDGDNWYSKAKSGSKKGISKSNTKSVLTQIGWERIVLDEAHNIKNRKSLMSKGCCRLLAFKRWALTGTPIHNELWDFYSLVKFLRISPFSDQGYWKEHMSDMSGKVATERLNTLVKSILLRRTKNQICSVTNKPLVDLKPRKFEVVEIQLEGVEEKCYQHMMEASKQKAKELINQQDNYAGHRRRKGTNVIKNPFVVGNREVDLDDKFQMMSCLLVLLLRLRQACVHMSLTKQAIDLDAFKDDGGEGAGDVMDELEKTFGNISLGAEEMIAQENKAIDKIFEPEYASGKLKVLLEKIDQVIEKGDKCVIVSQWTSMLDIVEQHLKKKKLKLTAINGKVLTKDRQERINSFNQKNGGAQVMLLSLTAGGVGLNLVGGNHLFLLDLHWNPALEQQACDRIYRVGQTKDVFIHKLICKDTIEQRVLDLQERKLQLATSVLEGAAKKQNKLTVNDLKFLFGLTKEQQQKPKPKEPYQGPNNVRVRE